MGPKTSLGYAGSANFRFAGWGVGNSEHSNIEAGVAMRERGKAREILRAILPKTEAAVALNGSTTGLVLTAREAEEDEGRPFPSFLHSVELRPNPRDIARLDLVVSLQEGEHEAFSLELPADDGETSTQLLAMAAGSVMEPCVVEIGAEIVRGLLRQRAVAVLWQEPSDAAELGQIDEFSANLPFGNTVTCVAWLKRTKATEAGGKELDRRA